MPKLIQQIIYIKFCREKPKKQHKHRGEKALKIPTVKGVGWKILLFGLKASDPGTYVVRE